MTVGQLLKELACADLDADVCMAGGMRLLGDVHVVHGVPGQVHPYVVLVAEERSA